MGAKAKRGTKLYCSFCHKPHTGVAKLVAGPGVYICDACIEIAAQQVKAHPKVAAFSGWDGYAEGELIRLLKSSVATLDAVRDDLQAKIDSLRRRDVSWTTIGEALGISRQAAWERFS